VSEAAKIGAHAAALASINPALARVLLTRVTEP
jgi:hypothetical protein